MSMFARRIRGNIHYIFGSEVGQSDKMWEFFAVLVVNINAEDKNMLMRELRDKIISSPNNPTLGAFLQLANEMNIPLQGAHAYNGVPGSPSAAQA